MPNFNKDPKEMTDVKQLADFDMEYFKQLEGEDGWLALDKDNCQNQQYFIALSSQGEKLGIIGVYDTADDKNITHTVVDPKFRGQGLAGKFKDVIMDNLDLPFITLTIDLDNKASLRAAEKLPGIKKISDEQYEKEFHKAKYIYERPKPTKED